MNTQEKECVSANSKHAYVKWKISILKLRGARGWRNLLCCAPCYGYLQKATVTADSRCDSEGNLAGAHLHDGTLKNNEPASSTCNSPRTGHRLPVGDFVGVSSRPFWHFIFALSVTVRSLEENIFPISTPFPANEVFKIWRDQAKNTTIYEKSQDSN